MVLEVEEVDENTAEELGNQGNSLEISYRSYLSGIGEYQDGRFHWLVSHVFFPKIFPEIIDEKHGKRRAVAS